jgi:hypothetical protein
MGWFLRKSLRVGPLRLNLSRRGIGASVGVKGLRGGIDAGGKPYVAGGRGGVYFRKRIDPEAVRGTSPGTPPRRGAVALGWIVAAVLAVVVLLLLTAR